MEDSSVLYIKVDYEKQYPSNESNRIPALIEEERKFYESHREVVPKKKKTITLIAIISQVEHVPATDTGNECLTEEQVEKRTFPKALGGPRKTIIYGIQEKERANL